MSESPTPTPTPTQSLSPMPVFQLLADYIAAAASGSRDSLWHLVLALFASARSALKCLVKHYQEFPRALSVNNLARLKYCSARLKAILYTLQHAPERFLAPSQLRALTRARAALAHIWRQPVDFSPLLPLLTSPDACPSPGRSTAPAPSSPLPPNPQYAPSSNLQSAISNQQSSSNPQSEIQNPQSSLLLRSPGCALAAVLIQLGNIYGIPAPRPASRTAPSHASHDSHSSHSSDPSHPSDPSDPSLSSLLSLRSLSPLPSASSPPDPG